MIPENKQIHRLIEPQNTNSTNFHTIKTPISNRKLPNLEFMYSINLKAQKRRSKISAEHRCSELQVSSVQSDRGKVRGTWVAKSSRMPSLLIPCSRQSCFQNSMPIWFPHCPTCNVMISRGISLSLSFPHFLSHLGFLSLLLPLTEDLKFSFAGSRSQFKSPISGQ